jgi:tRNA-dihydrouridine synthase 1
MVKAARMLENEVDAIDINFGCPQGIARKGRYGSFLLDEPDLI